MSESPQEYFEQLEIRVRRAKEREAEFVRLQSELTAANIRNQAYAIELDDAAKALAWKAIGLADGDSVASGIERLYENLTVRANRLKADNDDLHERLDAGAEIMRAALASDAEQTAELARLRRANALAEAALNAIVQDGGVRCAALAQKALVAMHAAASDADTLADAGAEGAVT